MSSFFGTTSSNDDLLVSSQFWIFWSVTIPLTVVVLITYTFWAQRAEVRDWYADKRRRKYQKQQKRLRDEKQRAKDLEKGETSAGGGMAMMSSQ